MVEGIHLQVNMNTALEAGRLAGEAQGSTESTRVQKGEDIRKENLQRAEDVNETEETDPLNADGEGSGQSGGRFWDNEEERENTPPQAKDPNRGNILDITR